MKWFAIFRTGKHTDNSGKTKEWTEADLDNIVAKYDPSKHEAPIVIGHPKENAPAFGWIEKLKRVGDTLYALPKQLQSDFAEMVRQGLFKKRSISLYPDGTLRHVGFLGATPPAVKGLPDVEFKDQDKDINIELSELPLDHDESTQQIEIDKLKQQIAEYEDKIKKLTELETKVSELENLKAKITELTIAKEKAEKNFSEMQKQLDEKQFTEFINKNISEGRLLPKIVPTIKKLWEATKSQDIFEFSDHTKSSPNSLLIEFIESLPRIIDLDEKSKSDNNINDKPISLIVAEEIKKQMNQ